MTKSTRATQIVDWKTAVIAGLIAGIIFLLVLLIAYPLATGGTPWVVMRFIAALILGESVLSPPNSYDLSTVIIGTITHIMLSIFYTVILAFIIHRWGIIVGIVGGGLFGLAIYAINFFTFTYFFDWFYPARTWPFLVVHVLFGAIAGGIYELMDTGDEPFWVETH